MRCATASSTREDAAEVVRELGASLKEKLPGPPSWVVMAHTIQVDGAALRRAWRASWPEIPLHRLSVCNAVLTDQGVYRGASTAVFAVHDPEGSYGVAYQPFDATRPHATGETGVERASARAQRWGEAPDLVFLSAAPGHEEAIIEGIQRELGGAVPIAGGSAADDAIEGAWSIGDADADGADGAVVSALFPTKPVNVAFSSGYAPTGIKGRVTAVRGRTLVSIDHRPAAVVYNKWTEGAIAAALSAQQGAVLSESTLAPLGRSLGRARYRLSHPASVESGSALSAFTEFSVGDELELMTGSLESLVERGQRVAASTLDGRSAAGCIVVFCAGCMLALSDRLEEVHRSLSEAIQKPFITLFTFGEQGPTVTAGNQHGNLMITAVAFGG